ncbi:MAG: TIGR01906 family membrane protein [Lachnospiraceae bacterium]|nr:TIGR01906 family membrane protein [Lachnospiraceae bacterium]
MKTKTVWIYPAGILCAVCFLLAFLITAIEAVAYWTPGYYEKEYTKYEVLNDLPEMTMEDLLEVTDEMMAFLRGKRPDLHVFTTMGGEYREFFNAREIAHMEDVRTLFIGGLWLRRICLLLAASLIGAYGFLRPKSCPRGAFSRALCVGTGAFFAVSFLIAGLIATDFSKYFVVFHRIFFRNDLWILDPRTDMLINIVPEPFFMDTAFRIGVLFAVMSGVFFAINFLIGFMHRKAALSF